MKISGRLRLHSLAIVATVVLVIKLTAGTPWARLALPAVIAAVVAMVIAHFVASTVTRPMAELSNITRSLVAGNLSSRPPLAAPGEVGELATAVHRLAEQLGSRMRALESEDSLLTALVESLNEGVVAIGPRNQVVRINSAGRKLMRVDDAVPFPTDRLPRVRELQYAMQSALQGATTEPVEIAVGDKVLSLTACPLVGGGAVLALFDLTRMRQLEIVRSDFVANVSHELRTPLTVISGFAETLMEDDFPSQQRHQFASTIRTHTQRMQRIVDELLDLSRLESGRWMPDLREVDVRAIANDTLAAVRASADAKGLELRVEVAESAEMMTADGTALRQVFANLVENAVRHTQRGSITVFAERETGGVRVGVKDTGPGIAVEHLPRIFERFYRVDAARARHDGGTGLGLAIVKHMVETHGGRVHAKSEIGKGTTISAFFPDQAA